MKKIYINESQINKELLLPKFLFDAVVKHETSLGDNPAFPEEDDYPFDYTVLKEGFKDVCEQMKDVGIPIANTDDMVSELGAMVNMAKELEKPVRDSLTKICENAINRLFAIPEGAVNIRCRLVDKVIYGSSIGVTPEISTDRKFRFKDIKDFGLSKAAIAKRRLINSLIMGASDFYMSMITLYQEDINKLNPELLGLYDKIITLNRYLTFVLNEELSDEKPKQGSFVEVHVGSNGKKNTIDAQGVIFPLLFHDLIKGFFELFSVHGLPLDGEKAEYIIGKSDFLLAEPWDMRFGTKLWQLIFDRLELSDDTNIVPYVFMELVKLPAEEFNPVMQELFMQTEKGDEIINKLIEKSRYNDGYQKFKNRVNARNVDRSMIADSYFTASELDGYDIDGKEDERVIQEDDAESALWNGKRYRFYNDDVKSITFFMMEDGNIIASPVSTDLTHEEVLMDYCYKLLGEEPPIREFDGKLDYSQAVDYIQVEHERLYNRLVNNVKIQGRIFLTDDGCCVFTCYDPLDDDTAKEMMTYAAFKLNLPKDKCYYVGHYNSVILPLVENKIK